MVRTVHNDSDLVRRQREVDHVTLGQHMRGGGLQTQLRQRAGELRVRRAGGGLGGLERRSRFAVAEGSGALVWCVVCGA